MKIAPETMTYYRADLVQDLRVLSDDLVRLAKRIEKGSLPNELGEIQGRGGQIDAKCARLATLMKITEDKL